MSHDRPAHGGGPCAHRDLEELRPRRADVRVLGNGRLKGEKAQGDASDAYEVVHRGLLLDDREAVDALAVVSLDDIDVDS